MEMETLVFWLIAGIGIGWIARWRMVKPSRWTYKPIRVKNLDHEKH